MTIPNSQYPAATRRRAGVDLGLLRDVLGFVLVVIGAVGLVAAAFMWCEPAGVAAVSIAVAAAGVALGYRR